MDYRNRRIDVNSLNAEQIESVSAQLGEKIRKISQEAQEQANAILNRYGMTCKMELVIEQTAHTSEGDETQ